MDKKKKMREAVFGKNLVLRGRKVTFLVKIQTGRGGRGPKMPLDLAQHLLPLTPCDITRYKKTHSWEITPQREECAVSM